MTCLFIPTANKTDSRIENLAELAVSLFIRKRALEYYTANIYLNFIYPVHMSNLFLENLNCQIYFL